MHAHMCACTLTLKCPCDYYVSLNNKRTYWQSFVVWWNYFFQSILTSSSLSVADTLVIAEPLVSEITMDISTVSGVNSGSNTFLSTIIGIIVAFSFLGVPLSKATTLSCKDRDDITILMIHYLKKDCLHHLLKARTMTGLPSLKDHISDGHRPWLLCPVC